MVDAAAAVGAGARRHRRRARRSPARLLRDVGAIGEPDARARQLDEAAAPRSAPSRAARDRRRPAPRAWPSSRRAPTLVDVVRRSPTPSMATARRRARRWAEASRLGRRAAASATCAAARRRRRARPCADASPSCRSRDARARRAWPTGAGRRRGARASASRRSPRTRRRLVRRDGLRFLFDPTRKLFSIGYNVADGTLDASYYDLLASEARLASFLAIAKGDVPAEHWFRLGRAADAGRPRLGADLVERLDVRVPDAAAGDARRRPAACSTRPTGSSSRARSATARERGVPWGISESGYNARDLELNYQYSSFGVPGLGLKRGLARGPGRSRPTRRALARDGRPRGGASRNLARLRARRRAAAATASTRRSTTRRARLPRGRDRSRSCSASWRTTRG